MVTVAHGTKVAVRADRLASESCFSSVFKHCPKALEDCCGDISLATVRNMVFELDPDLPLNQPGLTRTAVRES